MHVKSDKFRWIKKTKTEKLLQAPTSHADNRFHCSAKIMRSQHKLDTKRAMGVFICLTAEQAQDWILFMIKPQITTRTHEFFCPVLEPCWSFFFKYLQELYLKKWLKSLMFWWHAHGYGTAWMLDSQQIYLPNKELSWMIRCIVYFIRVSINYLLSIHHNWLYWFESHNFWIRSEETLQRSKSPQEMARQSTHHVTCVDLISIFSINPSICPFNWIWIENKFKNGIKHQQFGIKCSGNCKSAEICRIECSGIANTRSNACVCLMKRRWLLHQPKQWNVRRPLYPADSLILLVIKAKREISSLIRIAACIALFQIESNQLSFIYISIEII